MKKLMVFGISFASCMVVFLMTIFIFKEPITNYLVSNNNLKLVGVLYGKNTLYDVVARNIKKILMVMLFLEVFLLIM